MLRLGALVVPALAAAPFRLARPAGRQPEGLVRRGAPKQAIVVGAGLAGLAAAYELKQAGHEVTVLEAQARPGGRVQSLRAPFADGQYAEAGAMYILDSHQYVLDYIRAFNLPLYTFKPGDWRHIYYLGNQRYEVTSTEEPDDWPFALTADERALGYFGMLATYMAPIFEGLGDISDMAWPPDALKPYDAMTFIEFLRAQGASEGAVELLRLGFIDTWGDGIESVSALFMLRTIASHLNTLELHTLQGGNDQLPRAFAERLEADIHYGTPVVRIEQDDERVRVVYAEGGSHQTAEGDYLVCTLPFSVLRHLDVTQALSAERRQLIGALPYTSVTRVYVQCREQVWTDGPGAWSATDLPLMNINDHTFNQSGSRGILGSFAAGEPARHFATMDEPVRVQATLRYMAQVFPGIQDVFEAGTSKCWDKDPWAQGAYCYFKPGQMLDLAPRLAVPEGRIYFAGEHTSAWNGWMEGALESGRRAAEAINAT